MIVDPELSAIPDHSTQLFSTNLKMCNLKKVFLVTMPPFVEHGCFAVMMRGNILEQFIIHWINDTSMHFHSKLI